MLDEKRTLDEVVAIYSLEHDINDIYVEGPTDKFILTNFCEYKKVDKNVIEIDDIDLRELQPKYLDLNLMSNKDKLIALSRELSSYLPNTNVKCIVDRDFDGILYEISTNNNLLYTDFSCMESYILNEKQLKKLMEFGIKNFPHSAEKLISEISKILLAQFLMRMLNKHFDFNFKLPNIEKNISINKKTGVCSFDFSSYLETFINVNKVRDRKGEILTFIAKYEGFSEKDIRHTMNGHDFINMLFLYINNVKNTVNFRIENFERTVYLSVQPHYLDEYPLFKAVAN